MKRTCGLLLSFVLVLGTANAAADTRIIVRNTLGGFVMNTTCLLLGCKVQRGLGDPNSQLFLITVPPALTDNAPYNYYGATVKHGYVFQPATCIVGLDSTQAKWGTRGGGTVAVIDTGVDPDHPVLKPVLLPGYDFTRNSNSANEKGDVTQSTVAVLDNAEPAYVNQSTVAVLDQSTVAVLDDQKYAAFVHGTMTAGVIHLVAPSAKIMPLKAFGADGSGYVSDVMRAIYYAQKNGATVINMSFSFQAYSPELKNAVNYATNRGVICVASAGNESTSALVYPAAFSNVMGVASTSNFDALSGFGGFASDLRVKELEQQVLSMRTAVICGFNQLLDLKDLNTGVHSTRLAEWAVRVAEALGIDETVLRDVEAAAVLHDIGKIGVPDAILNKPGKLTEDERQIINKHPEYGWAIQRLIPGLERTSLFTLHHHENFDGTGYPGRLRGCDTPIGSRIVSVIDAFDAMVSNRPYRKGLPVEEAIRRLIMDSGTQFDPEVVCCFIKIAEPEVADVFAATGTSMSVIL